MLSSVSFRRCKGTATFGLFQKIRQNLLRVVATAPDSCDKAAASRLNVVVISRFFFQKFQFGIFDNWKKSAKTFGGFTRNAYFCSVNSIYSLKL